MALSESFQVDKTAFSVTTLSETDDELGYWLTKTPQERLAAVEATRQTLYGSSSTSPGLQRFFEIAQREKSGL